MVKIKSVTNERDYTVELYSDIAKNEKNKPIERFIVKTLNNGTESAEMKFSTLDAAYDVFDSLCNQANVRFN